MSVRGLSAGVATDGCLDLFAQDVTVTGVSGVLGDHRQEGPSHTDQALAGLAFSVVEAEAGCDLP